MSVAASLISGIGSSLFNIGSTVLTNQANAQLAKENREFYKEQWMRENAYNDPSAVMARMARAGLNPALMYGEGAGALPASASMSSTDPAQMRAPVIDPLLAAQIGNLNADTELKKADEDKKRSDIDVNKGIINLNERTSVYYENLSELTKKQQDEIVARCRNLDAQTEQANSTIALNKAQIASLDAQTQQKWFELNLRSDETWALIEKYQAETAWTNEQCRLYAGYLTARINNLNADTSLKKMEEGLTKEQIEEVKQEVLNAKVVNGQLKWDLQMSERFDVGDRRLARAQMGAAIVQSVYSSSQIELLGHRAPSEKLAKKAFESIKDVQQPEGWQ